VLDSAYSLTTPADISTEAIHRDPFLAELSTAGVRNGAEPPRCDDGFSMGPYLPAPCRDLLELQYGVIARWQAPQAGLAPGVLDNELRHARWQTLYRGVYATFTGSPSRSAILCGAALRAGPGAVLSHHTAAELDGITDKPAGLIHVTVGPAKQIAVSARETRGLVPRVIVHRNARIDAARHPSRIPPRTRIEETTLDLAQVAGDAEEALAWLTRACSRRLTTPDLIRAAMAARPKLRWRAELTNALPDVQCGTHSALEWRYVRRVERPHGLPRAIRQSRSNVGGRTRYLDNHYRDFGVAVELDGQATHPAEERWQDIHRDNASAASGLVTLRYNWADVTARPCLVAGEISALLRLRGWTGALRRCGPGCRAQLP
jgi:very-short-patch-repair endonuclease